MNSRCPRCNEPVFEFSEVCQVCGCELEGGAFNDYDDENHENQPMIDVNILICRIRMLTKSNGYTFITISKLEDFGQFKTFTDVYNEFYVFKSHLHPNLTNQGQQITLTVEKLNYFVTDNKVKIFYLRDEMTNFDVMDLKTYNFNKG